MTIVNSTAHLLKSDQTDKIVWSIKTRLATSIEEYRQANNLTQKEIAQKLGVNQPRYSNLKNGSLDKFSIDQLIKLNVKIGNKLSPWHLIG